MKRKEAIKTIIQSFNNKQAIISSTGLISRELFSMEDSPQNFYMVGSMGLASSIGLGVATNKPNLKVIIIDGDASLLMNLGSLTTIGHIKPRNFIHILLDNNAYDSCSGEPSVSKTAKLDKIAKVVGYNVVKKVENPKELKKAIKKSLAENQGPVFILAKIEPGGKRELLRPLKLDKLARRFKNFLSEFN